MLKYTEKTQLKEIIPKGSYCYFGSRGNNGKDYRICPFYRSHIIAANPNRHSDAEVVYVGKNDKEGIKEGDTIEALQYPLYDLGNRKYPYYEIGECTLLHISDLDNPFFSLLWDQVKECGINED